MKRILLAAALATASCGPGIESMIVGSSSTDTAIEDGDSGEDTGNDSGHSMGWDSPDGVGSIDTGLVGDSVRINREALFEQCIYRDWTDFDFKDADGASLYEDELRTFTNNRTEAVLELVKKGDGCELTDLEDLKSHELPESCPVTMLAMRTTYPSADWFWYNEDGDECSLGGGDDALLIAFGEQYTDLSGTSGEPDVKGLYCFARSVLNEEGELVTALVSPQVQLSNSSSGGTSFTETHAVVNKGQITSQLGDECQDPKPSYFGSTYYCESDAEACIYSSTLNCGEGCDPSDSFAAMDAAGGFIAEVVDELTESGEAVGYRVGVLYGGADSYEQVYWTRLD